MDINKFKCKKNNRYSDYIKSRRSQYDTSSIEKTIKKTCEIIKSGVTSTIIYGQPQSGKTDMMIGLCAKLFDEGYDLIIVLIQDNIQLDEQNMTRFASSGINPSPIGIADALEPDYDLKNNKNLVFCRKNANKLRKFLPKVENISNKIILDDETDYATPNAKINKKEVTTINGLVTKLFGNNSVYIGVTATPARNALNNTLNTDPKKWIYFEPHTNYYGCDFFFPDPLLAEEFQYNFVGLKDESSDQKKEIREAFFEFCVNVAYLNLTNKKDEKFIMLIHSSLKIVDHIDEKKIFLKIKNSLICREGKTFEQYAKHIHHVAERKLKKYIGDHSLTADDILHYVLDNMSRSGLGVLDVEGKKEITNKSDYTTDPLYPFTIVIGGNTISRGLTFTNMLGMYFSRDVKGKMGQGTYIQRARMFGKRDSKTLPHFTLTMPLQLYARWWDCFEMYKLQLLHARAGNPVYTETSDNKVVPGSSIDKAYVDVDKGSCGFDIVPVTPELEQIIEDLQSEKISKIDFLKKISDLPRPLITKVWLNEVLKSKDENAYVIHRPTAFIDDMKYADIENITRTKGGLLSGGMEKKYPNASYHFWPLRNKKGNIRLWFFNRSGESRITYFKSKKWSSEIV
tara:strand:- start:175 stop:2052 length:1878 start_codon:yes stop_codon:yes gene_type:complete